LWAVLPAVAGFAAAWVAFVPVAGFGASAPLVPASAAFGSVPGGAVFLLHFVSFLHGPVSVASL
jgi:hypothetical protein